MSGLVARKAATVSRKLGEDSGGQTDLPATLPRESRRLTSIHGGDAMQLQDTHSPHLLVGRVGRFDIMSFETKGFCVYDPDYPLAGPFDTKDEAVRRAEAEAEKLRRRS
jgi:hypothetical protein